MRFFLLLLCVLTFSCKNKSTDTGSRIPAKTMQKVLLDINLAEAYSAIVKDTSHRTAGKNADSLASYYHNILKHYNITSKEFEESLNWYKAHPDKLDTLYNGVIPLITTMQNPKPLKQVAPLLLRKDGKL
jgi:hypothetical protein